MRQAYNVSNLLDVYDGNHEEMRPRALKVINSGSFFVVSEMISETSSNVDWVLWARMGSSVFVCLGRSANCRLWLQINKPITMARIIASQSLNIFNLIKQMRNEGNCEILAGIK